MILYSDTSYPVLFRKGYFLPKINGLYANKTRRNNLISIGVEMITHPEDKQFPTIFSRPYIKQAIRKVLPAKHYSTLFYYENYITEFAKQNKCEPGFYNLENIVEVVVNECDLADERKETKRMIRQRKWYHKIKYNAMRLMKDSAKEIKRIKRLAAYKIRTHVRKIKFSCQITAEKIKEKFKIVRANIIEFLEQITSETPSTLALPSGSYRIKEEEERRIERTHEQMMIIQTFSENEIRKGSFRQSMMSVKASKKEITILSLLLPSDTLLKRPKVI